MHVHCKRLLNIGAKLLNITHSSSASLKLKALLLQKMLLIKL
jgi:hypothetical protein